MDINAIIIRVQRQFGDESGVQVQDSDIIRWINDAVHEACMQHELLISKQATVAAVVGTQAYSLPTDCIDLQTIDYVVTGEDTPYSMQSVAQKFLNEHTPGWLTTGYQATPTFFTRGRTEGQFLVYPTPDVTGTFTLTYGSNASDVAEVTDDIPLPIIYHSYVLEYCLMKAYEMDEEWEVADRKAAYVQSTLDFNNHRASWFGRESYPVIQTTSEDYI